MLITICCRHSWHIWSLKLHLPPGTSWAHTSHCSVMIALNVKNTPHLWVSEGFWPAAATTGEHSSKYQTPEKETRFVLFICTERLMQLWRHSVKNRKEKNFSCRKDSNTTDQQETVLPNNCLKTPSLKHGMVLCCHLQTKSQSYNWATTCFRYIFCPKIIIMCLTSFVSRLRY